MSAGPTRRSPKAKWRRGAPEARTPSSNDKAQADLADQNFGQKSPQIVHCSTKRMSVPLASGGRGGGGGRC